MNKPNTEKYCYSWDEEYYSNELYDSPEAAILAAKAEKQAENLKEEEVFIAKAVHPELTWLPHEEEIIESMREGLEHEYGEDAYGGLEHITAEMETELAKMIDQAVKEWIERNHIVPDCYSLTEIGIYPLSEPEAGHEEKLTKNKEEEVRKSIIQFIETYGYPPTVREIGDMTGLKSTSSVKRYLDRMLEEGILETDHECSPRAIRVKGYRYVKEEA